MTLQQLRYFCTMAKMLHYTKAAEVLYISQPSLSYALAELEKELGVPLFEKQGKQVSLTKYGTTFLPYAQSALEDLSRGLSAIEQLNHPIINVGYVYSLSFDYMPRLIDEFYSFLGHRRIAFNLVEGFTTDMITQLHSGNLDMVFTTKLGDPTVEHIPVFKQDLYLVVPQGHPLAQKEEITIFDLKDESFITMNPRDPLRMYIEDYFHAAGIEPKVIFSVGECDAICAFVASNLGIAIMPLTPSLSSHRVSILKIKDPLARLVYLLTKKDRHLDQAARIFYDYLVTQKRLADA